MAATDGDSPTGVLTLPVQNRGFGDNAQLSPKPGPAGSGGAPSGGRSRGRQGDRAEREAAELGAMVGRMMMALARRAEGGDLEAMAQLRDLDLALAVAQRKAIKGLVEQAHYSHGEIGLRLGMSRQAVRQRWARD